MPRKTSMNGSSVAIQPPPPQKQKRGLFSFVFGKKTSKTSVVNSSSLSGGSIGDRSVSPVRSTSPDVSNSISPTTPPLATSSVVSAPSYSEKISSAKSLETMSMISDTSSTKGSGGVARFKKRQAPAPPPVNRMSSPLSKEHLSKLPETSKLQSAFSKSTSNLAYENRPGNRLSLSNLATANSTSTSSILSALRKSKKAPPPPSNAVHSSEATDERMVEEDKPVPTTKTEEATTIRTPEVEIKVEEPPVIVDKPSPVDTIDKKVLAYTNTPPPGDMQPQTPKPNPRKKVNRNQPKPLPRTLSLDALDIPSENVKKTELLKDNPVPPKRNDKSSRVLKEPSVVPLKSGDESLHLLKEKPVLPAEPNHKSSHTQNPYAKPAVAPKPDDVCSHLLRKPVDSPDTDNKSSQLIREKPVVPPKPSDRTSQVVKGKPAIPPKPDVVSVRPKSIEKFEVPSSTASFFTATADHSKEHVDQIISPKMIKSKDSISEKILSPTNVNQDHQKDTDDFTKHLRTANSSESSASVSISDDFGSDIDFDESLFAPKSQERNERRKWGSPSVPVITIQTSNVLMSSSSSASSLSQISPLASERRSSFEEEIDKAFIKLQRKNKSKVERDYNLNIRMDSLKYSSDKDEFLSCRSSFSDVVEKHKINKDKANLNQDSFDEEFREERLQKILEEAFRRREGFVENFEFDEKDETIGQNRLSRWSNFIELDKDLGSSYNTDKGDASSEEVAPEISEMEIQKESLNTTTSTISSDSLDVSQEERSPEVISRNEKEELSYDDVANTTERRGVKETDSDAYEDIELKTEENAEKPSTLLKDGNEKSEPVYAQVNKKKKNSKQEESVNGTIELTEISVSPLSDAPSDSNSSSNDSAIEISPTVIISRSSSPLDTWEYKIPDPPTPFKDLSSDEEVSDIVSDLLNTASFQEALLNESEGETKKVDEIIDVISETGPETLTITEPVKPDISEIVLQNEYIGESTTDVKKHVAINNLYETLDTQALKELTCKEASQVSEILVELSETLKKRESDSEVKEAPPVPDTIPPTESSESSRRSSISELSDKMRFSISTYKSRVEEEGLCYEKKLSRVDSKKSTGLDNDLSRRSSVCSESSRTSEIRDQNENVIKISELHDPIIIPPPIILDEPLVTEELIISENNVESIVLPPMDFVSEITSDSLIEKVELKKEQIILDLAKLEPVATDPSSLSNSTLSSRRNSVTPNVEPSSDLPSPLSLLLPAPSLFADDEDPEAIRLQEEYIQFQQRILAYQQKRLNQGSKNCVKQSEPCETPELANPEKNNYKAGEFSAVVEKSESMDKKVETPPKLQDENKVEAVNSTTSTSSLTTSIFQQVEQDITKNGAADLPRLHVAHKTVVNGNHILDNLRHEENEPVILTLNEDHIKAFSEIIEEKERSPSTQEDKVDMIPAPLTFSSNQPVMLDGICQTESDDYHSLVGIDTNSRPESQTSTRSGSDQPDDEIFRYRYQGPPKVVMEPWRSRPSVHVSISTNPVNAFNLDDLESKINAKKVEETIEVKELPKVESVKLKPVKENLENKDEKSQVESRKLSFESSRSAFESVTNRKPNLVRRTSIDTPRPFELKSLSQVRRPMFNPVQVGNKVVQPKMPFRVPEVRGFPLRTHSEAEEKSFVEKSRHDLIALARRPSAERDLISSEDRHHLSKLRDETDASRKIDVVVRRKVSIMERPKSADELDATAPNAKEASQKVGTLKHSTSADFQTSFWNELNGIKLRPVAGKQTEACAHLASVPAPPGPAPHISISTQSLPLLKKSNSSKIQSPIDTRGDLLNSIRSFGESNGLKKTGIRLT
ncbi:uncharacterized protein LOC136043853 isoform X2 [Artemia franciscana]